MSTNSIVDEAELNPLLKSFEKIYIINLLHRIDRREEMKMQLSKIGLSLDHSSVILFSAVKPESFDGWPSRGAKGCFMSHLGILQDAKSKGYQSILILEDDLNFNEDFMTQFSIIAPTIQSENWNIFYGGYELLSTETNAFLPTDGKVSSSLNIIKPTTPVRTTHFIGFKSPAIILLSSYLEEMARRPSGDSNGGPMHVDGAYSWFRKDNPSILTFIATPQLGYQRSSATDIADKKWFDILPLISTGVSLLRKLKNFLK